MDTMKATESEKALARELYGQKKDEVELEVNSYAEDDVFKQALLDEQFRTRMRAELAVPEEKYTKKHQQDTNELMLNVAKRYDCNLAEAFVKLVEFKI